MTILAAENIDFRYDGVNVFERVSFAVDGSHVVGVISPNGSGKSTLFDLLAGACKPQAGRILSTFGDAEKALLVQSVSLPWLLTVAEIAKVIVAANVEDRHFRFEGTLEQMDRAHLQRYEMLKGRRFGRCSVGERRWLASVLLLSLPGKRLFLLDEPTAGVDPEFRLLIWDAIHRRSAEGHLVFVSSHLLNEFDARVGQILFLHNRAIESYANMDSFKRAFAAADADKAFIAALA